jgi:L-lysine 2,3-aminomutase
MMKRQFEVYCRYCDYKEMLEIDPADLEKWRTGILIQNALPYLNASQRELLISGTCNKCWKRLWNDETA